MYVYYVLYMMCKLSLDNTKFVGKTFLTNLLLFYVFDKAVFFTFLSNFFVLNFFFFTKAFFFSKHFNWRKFIWRKFILRYWRNICFFTFLTKLYIGLFLYPLLIRAACLEGVGTLVQLFCILQWWNEDTQ